MLLMIIIIAVVFICISEIRQLNTTNNATNNATNIREKFIIEQDTGTPNLDYLRIDKNDLEPKETRKQHEDSGGFPHKYRDTMINPPA